MLDTLLSIFSFILLIAYVYFGNMANNWFKYHIMGVRAEIYSDTGQHYFNKAFWAILLGWATIPLAILLSVIGVGKNDD